MKKTAEEKRNQKLSLIYTSIGIVSILLAAFNILARILFCEKTIYGKCSIESALSFIPDTAVFTVVFGLIGIAGIIAGAAKRAK